MATESTDPKRTAPFYGWVIVRIATLQEFIAVGMGTWVIGVFVVPMEQEMGWSRTAIFLAIAIRAGVNGVLAPLVGPLVDRKHGARILVPVAAIFLGGALIATSHVQSLLQYYLIFGVVAALGIVGAGTEPAEGIVSKWFVRKRGRALAFATSGGSIGALVFPIATALLIEQVGWRDAWTYLGITTMVVLVPAGLFLRRRPEDMGLHPDGADGPPETVRAGRPAVSDYSFTPRQVLGTRTFWVIILALALSTLSLGGFHPNLIPHFQGLGFSAILAGAAQSVYGVSSMAFRFGWGLLAERVHVRYAFMLQSVLTAGAILFILTVQNTFMMFVSMAVVGATAGGFFLMWPLVLANYFGREHIGAIRGMSRPFLILSTTGGPIMVASLWDRTGNYNWSFGILLVAWLLTAATMTLARPLRQPPVESRPQPTAG